MVHVNPISWKFQKCGPLDIYLGCGNLKIEIHIFIQIQAGLIQSYHYLIVDYFESPIYKELLRAVLSYLRILSIFICIGCKSHIYNWYLESISNILDNRIKDYEQITNYK